MWLKHLLCALWFGHRKKYLSVEVRKGGYGGVNCGAFFHQLHWSQDNYSLTRWVCERCDKMGEKCLGDTKNGRWTIVNGRLVPDEKKWANFDSQ